MWETIIANIPVAGIAAISVGLLRNLAGWIENKYKDGEDAKWDWKELAGTMVKYFAGISLFMLGMPVGEAIVFTFGFDMGSSALKNR